MQDEMNSKSQTSHVLKEKQIKSNEQEEVLFDQTKSTSNNSSEKVQKAKTKLKSQNHFCTKKSSRPSISIVHCLRQLYTDDSHVLLLLTETLSICTSPHPILWQARKTLHLLEQSKRSFHQECFYNHRIKT